MFYIKAEKSKIVSIVIELAAIVVAQISFGGSIIFYLVGVAIDTCRLDNKIVKYLFQVLTLLITISSTFTKGIEERAIYFVLLTILFVLLNYISRLYNTKIKAQNLYDKLRVSEEKLIVVNKELEGYVNTIEEITLLKERNRISREIHDSVGHALSTAMIQLSAVLMGNKQSANSNYKFMITIRILFYFMIKL